MCKAIYIYAVTFALSLDSASDGMEPKLSLVWMADVRGAKTSMHPLWHPARTQSSGVTATAVMGP